MVVSLAAIIAVALTAFMRDDGAAVQFDPTWAQRIHFVREHGLAADYDAFGALRTHLLRENAAAPDSTLFDHVLRENQRD